MENRSGLRDMRRGGHDVGMSSGMRWLRLVLLGVMLLMATHKVIVRHGRTRLGIIGVVDIETSQQMLVIDRWRLTCTVHGGRIIQLQ